MKKAFALSLLVAFLPPTAQAHHLDDYDARIRAEASLPAAWFACKTNDDCALVSVPCQSGLAVSATYAEEAQDRLNHTYFFCLGSAVDDVAASCEARRCVTEPKKK
ncbi:hypothetical protein OGR47_06120 [Methylocystis sp. MJC1]|jgi:hypothetical protein|uniref:hypothetical protein n=1 Tax=Methylocystis sp. MJC1 TaxID=2654282 RepID=UPI0013ECB989|nr:hypothetical protein [Methylocystis sp. MJC1]KAF2992608.1 hypothetical protein MJC1_00186 [Methylocystis sp. MJC1]MBU6526575.1 hypothetical protein [Methylocystis sp. MJC1]UZX13021.1 hypothetical protein OGR47_06120 [Methylocystis sp. MJC1]